MKEKLQGISTIIKTNKKAANRKVLIITILLLFLIINLSPVAAQNVIPPPVICTGLVQMTDYASRLIPSVKQIIESVLLRRFIFLSTVLAQLVMLFSFIKLYWESPGVSKQVLAWGARWFIFLPLILAGPFLVSYLWKLGQVITTPLAAPVQVARDTFEKRYEFFVAGNFLAIAPNGSVYARINTDNELPTPDTGPGVLIGVLRNDVQNAKDVGEFFKDDKANMPKWFSILSIGRGVIAFADFILIIISGFLMIAFRLAVPWMIALGGDKTLANEIRNNNTNLKATQTNIGTSGEQQKNLAGLGYDMQKDLADTQSVTGNLRAGNQGRVAVGSAVQHGVLAGAGPVALGTGAGSGTVLNQSGGISNSLNQVVIAEGDKQIADINRSGARQAATAANFSTQTYIDKSVEKQTTTEAERTAGLNDAAQARTGTQLGAVNQFNQSANSAARTYAGDLTKATNVYTGGAKEATITRMGESVKAIETVREAGLKADVYSYHLKKRGEQIYTIATAGVGNSHELILDATRETTLLIGYDRDHRTNVQVCRQMARLIRERYEDGQGARTFILDWDRVKGIDEAVQLHIPINTLTLDCWLEGLSAESKSRIAEAWNDHQELSALVRHSLSDK